MAFTPKNGTDGRVKSGSNTVAGITAWSVTEDVGEIQGAHFESTANADGIVVPTWYPGLGGWVADVEGIYNTDATDGTEQGTPALRMGKSVTLDLVADKANSKGYDGCAGFVKNFQRGMQINNTLMTFKMQVRGTGALPAFGTIS
jgi:hypothetical protein